MVLRLNPNKRMNQIISRICSVPMDHENYIDMYRSRLKMYKLSCDDCWSYLKKKIFPIDASNLEHVTINSTYNMKPSELLITDSEHIPWFTQYTDFKIFILNKQMNVKKRNGKLEQFNEQKIRACIDRCCVDKSNETYVGVDPDAVMFNARIKLFDGIKTSEIDASLVKSARGMIEQEPNYKYVASKLLLNTIYKEVFGTGVDSDAFALQYRTCFIVNLKKADQSRDCKS